MTTSLDTGELTLIETRLTNEKKSTGTAYLLWFFLGWTGAHNFYIKRPVLAIIELVLGVTGMITVWFAVGFFILIPVWIMLFIDMFTIPGRIQALTDIRRNELTQSIRQAKGAQAAEAEPTPAIAEAN